MLQVWLFLVLGFQVVSASLFNNCSETPNESLRNVTVINGLRATFQCDRHHLGFRSWVVNGMLLSKVPNPLKEYIDTSRNDTTDLLKIVGNSSTNGTMIGCYVRILNNITESNGTAMPPSCIFSQEVMLTVQELKNISKLSVERDRSSHSRRCIVISWDGPENLNVSITEVRITYCIEIEKERQLLRRECNITERSHMYCYEDGSNTDPNPCNDVSIRVTPHIGISTDYPGITSMAKRAYFYAEREDTIDAVNVIQNVSVIGNPDSEVFQFGLQLPASRPVCRMIINATSRQDEAESSRSRMSTSTGVGFTNTINISSDRFENGPLPFDDILFVTIKLIYNYTELNTSVTTLHANLSTFNTQNLTAINGTITAFYANGTNALGSLLVLVKFNASNPVFKLKPVERQNFIAMYNLSVTEHFNLVMAFDIGSNGILKEQSTVKPAVEFSVDLHGTIEYPEEGSTPTSPLLERIFITPNSNGITVHCDISDHEITNFKGCLTHILDMTNFREMRPYRMDFTSNPNKSDTYLISPGEYHVTVFLWANNGSGLLHSPSKSEVVTVTESSNKGRKSSHQTMTMLLSLMVAMVYTYSTFMIEC